MTRVVFASYGHTYGDRPDQPFRNSVILTMFGAMLGCRRYAESIGAEFVDLSPSMKWGVGVDWEHVNAIAASVPPCDVLYTQAGIGLPILQRARELSPSARLVLQRDSTHAAHHLTVMRRQMHRHGLVYTHQYQENDSALLNREIAEYELADAIFVLSRRVKESFEVLYLGDKTHQFASQLADTSLWWDSPVRDLSGEFHVVYVGSLGLRKGTFDLLEGWRQFMARHQRPARLTLLGLPDGAEDPKLGGALAHRITQTIASMPTVRAIGWAQPPHGPRAYYHAAHAYVSASIEDGSTMPGVEAALCGLPLLATNASGIDLLEEGVTGRVIEEESPGHVAAVLEWAAANRGELRTMGARAAERASHCDVEDYATGVARTLARVCG